MNFIAGWIIQLLSGPLLGAWKAWLGRQTDIDTLRSNLAIKEMELDTALKVAQVGHFWEVEKLFGYVTLVYYAKVLLWDAAFHMGVTDPVKGDVGIWAGLVIGFYFTKRGAESVARILKR